MNRFFATLCFAFLAVTTWSQNKDVTIRRIDEAVVVDGVVNESFWDNCPEITDFIQNTPVAGAHASRKTVVKMAYDDEAIYIAAEMFDERDSMSLTLSQRDNFGNADWFGVVIDPYNAGTIGFAFLVTSAGVQIDELHDIENIDNNWNAVWRSEVTVEEDKWSAELKIPFSALRFPKQGVQTWGVNFMRNIRRNREQSYWNFYDPKGVNLIGQLGTLYGIQDVVSPVRLSFTPYVSGYLENNEGQNGTSFNGGMDVKYGLNEAFTLDMTLIPDFGQVQFDQQILNLSPFEVQFNENRQFFTEGIELFNKQGLFYSRRVGGRPVNFNQAEESLEEGEVVLENPLTTQLLNATKLSGRTKKGTGIGVFNAITQKMHALILDTASQEIRAVETAPAANYNVLVIDQNLKNNSSITLTNTNVMRNGHTYDANVTALGSRVYTKGQKYLFEANGIVSQIFETAQPELGHKITGRVGRVSGNFLWMASYSESSKTYDQNDLGFQTNNNVRNWGLRLNYNIFKPFWRLYRVWSSLGFGYGRLVSPGAFSSFNINSSVNGTFRNFMTAGVFINAQPVRNHDWFEPRVEGRFFETDQNVEVGGFISSDYSKPFALDMNNSVTFFNEKNRFSVSNFVSARFRFNDRFSLIYDFNIDYEKNNEGVALTRDYEIPLENGNPVFAKRNRLTVINRFAADYIFTNRMGLTFALRHYWSRLIYQSFYDLNAQGQLIESSYTGAVAENGNSLHDNSFDAFTIDMVYRWVFAPGSELSLVWKNAIFNSSESVANGYLKNLSDLVQYPAVNSLSFKLLYYIDFWTTKKQFSKI